MEMDTLWGSFTPDEVTPPGTEEETKTPDSEKEPEGKVEDKGKSEEELAAEQEAADKAAEEAAAKEEEDKKKEEDEDKSTEDLSDEDIFTGVDSLLKEEELIFVPEDKTYEKTPEGLAEMMRDNMEGYKAKLEKEFEDKERDIASKYEMANGPSIEDMDPENDADATEMLSKYYKETGLDEDEIKEKLVELKDLDYISKEAKVAKRYLVKQDKEAKESAKEAEAAKTVEDQKRIDDYIDGVKTEIDSMDKFVGFKMTNKIKSDFKDYLFKVGKDGKTPAQKAGKDSDRRMRLAFYDFIDYNKKDLEIKAKTEVSKDLKKKTSRFTSTQSGAKGKTIQKQGEVKQEPFKPGFLDFFSVGGE